MKRLELFWNAVQVPVDFFLLLGAAASAYALRFTPFFLERRPVLFTLTLLEYLRISAFVAIGWMILFAISGLYVSDPNRRFFPDIVKIFFSCSAGLAGVALYLLFTQQIFDSRFLAAASWSFAIVYVTLGRLALRGCRFFLYRRGIGCRRVAIIGKDPGAQTLAALLRARRGQGYLVIGVFPRFSPTAFVGLPIDELLFARPPRESDDAVEAIVWCMEQHIAFKYSADVLASYATNMSVQPIGGVPIIEIRRTKLEGWWRIVKRLVDVVLAFIVFFLVMPIMAATAIAILLETGGPIIYKNERVGFRGNKFFLLKFRSMYQHDCTGPQFGASGAAAEEREKALIRERSARQGPIYKIADDPRVTPLGRVLRRWSIDELPQLVNVLIGEMSLVGPRPHQPREVAAYDRAQKRIFFLKPGITGLAQISGRSDLSFEEEGALDVFYMEHWSPWLDTIILLKTPFAIVRHRNVV